jgi:hypothetical protein
MQAIRSSGMGVMNTCGKISEKRSLATRTVDDDVVMSPHGQCATAAA